jgi:hypothetical protein
MLALLPLLLFGPHHAFLNTQPCAGCSSGQPSGPCGRTYKAGSLQCSGYAFSNGVQACPPGFYDCNHACPLIRFVGRDAKRSGVCDGVFHRTLDQGNRDAYPVYKGACKQLGGEAIMSFTRRYNSWVVSDRIHDIPKWSLMSIKSEVRIPALQAGMYLLTSPTP